MSVRFSPKANQRLDEIWTYTFDRWGESQADAYLRGLFDFLGAAADRHYTWKRLSEGGFEGVYYLRYEHHFVFFRKLKENGIGVISILHERMHIPDRLKEDTET